MEHVGRPWQIHCIYLNILTETKENIKEKVQTCLDSVMAS